MEAWAIIVIVLLCTGGGTYLGQLLIRGIIDYLKQKNAQLTAVAEGLQSVLRHKLQEDAQVYLARGSISPREFCLWDKDYHSYHALGANGVMDDIKNKICQLPQKENEDD